MVLALSAHSTEALLGILHEYNFVSLLSHAS